MTNQRSKAHRVVLFNHKGGVGKTTLTVNLAAAIGELGKKVLLVDSDPQCNLTSYLLADDVVDDLLDKSDAEDGATVWSCLKPVSEATGNIRTVEPKELHLKNLFLLPGDIRLSEFETDLTEFWGQCLQRKTKGFRGTTALSILLNELTRKFNIDYVFYDTGPNIGPLNRTILLDCDYLIIPVACDLFSRRALKTLGHTLAKWINEWTTIADLAPEELYLLPGKFHLLGYIPERFRVYGGQMTSQQSHFLSGIEKEIHDQVVARLKKINPDLAKGRLSHFKLGGVKHLGELIPASQKAGTPIWEAMAGSPQQRESARTAFFSIARKIVQRATDKG